MSLFDEQPFAPLPEKISLKSLRKAVLDEAAAMDAFVQDLSRIGERMASHRR